MVQLYVLIIMAYRAVMLLQISQMMIIISHEELSDPSCYLKETKEIEALEGEEVGEE